MGIGNETKLKIALTTAAAAGMFALAACAGAPANTPAAAPANTSAPTVVATVAVEATATVEATETSAATAEATVTATTETIAPATTLTPTEIVTVSMKDFSFIFTPTQVSAGVVKFVVQNDAASSVHEFFLVETDLAVDKLPLKADGTSIDEDSTQFTKVGSVEDVDAGKSGEMTVKLDPGHYVYFCNTTGHYKSGMAGEVTIPATGSASLTSSMNMGASAGMTSTEVAGATEVVTVSMTNYAFKFTPSTIKAGTVKFVVNNDATDQMHEFFVVKTDLAVDKLPLAADGASIDEDSTLFTKIGSVEDVDAGKSGEMTIKLDPGRYVYFCNKQGHYKAGMAGELMVAP